MEAGSAYMSVHESHLFAFPPIDFNGQASGAVFSGQPLKLPSQGDWWIHGILATRVATNIGGELASGTNININIFDAGQGKNWWTGGNQTVNPLLPLQLVAGKSGNPHVFSEAKLVKGGSTLTPYLNQTSGGTPAVSSLLYVVLIATLAETASGNVPILPSLGGSISAKKGEHYKANVLANFSAKNLIVNANTQFNMPLNRESSMIVSQMTTDYVFTEFYNWDPRVTDQQVLVNVFDTRTSWKWASPQGVPISLLFGPLGSRPFVAPSFFYIAPDQNLAVEVTNNTNATLTSDVNFVFDGYLQEDVLGERVR